MKQLRGRKGSIYPSVAPSGSGVSPSSTLREVRERWTAIKLAIGDSQNFLDLISGLNWRDGLAIEAMNLIKSQLCLGGGQGREKEQGLVTFSAARHAAEVVGVMFGFAVGMVRYTGLHQTHLLAVEKLNRSQLIHTSYLPYKTLFRLC